MARTVAHHGPSGAQFTPLPSNPWSDSVEQYRRLVGKKGKTLAQHLLIGAQHALRIDHALRLLRRAGREQELGDRVRPDALMRGRFLRDRRAPRC
jgi:hypothetical protein